MAIYSLDEYGQPIVGNALSLEGEVVYGQVLDGRDSIVRPWKMDILEVAICAHPSTIDVGKTIINQIKPTEWRSQGVVAYREVESVRSLDGMSHPFLMYLLAETTKVVEPISRPVFTLGRTLSSECFYLGDAINTYRWKIVSEVIGIVDSRATTLSRDFAEIVWAIHHRSTTMSRTCAESLTLLEVRILEVYYLESLRVLDIVDRQFARMLYDLVGLRERASPYYVLRYFEEIVHAAERTIKEDTWMSEYGEPILAGNIDGLGEFQYAPTLDRGQRTFNIISKLYSLGHICADRIAVSDIAYKAYSLSLMERLRALDLYSREVARQFSETCLLGENRISSVLVTFVESVHAYENRILDSVKDLIEVVRMYETRRVTSLREFADGITLSDVRSSYLVRNFSEGIQVVDSRMSSAMLYLVEESRIADFKVRQFYREIAESMRFYDGKYAIYTKILNERFSLLESQFAVLNRILNESFRLLDFKAKSISRTFLEPVYFVESRFLTFYYAETMAISDSISKVLEVIREDCIRLGDRIKWPEFLIELFEMLKFHDATIKEDFTLSEYGEPVYLALTPKGLVVYSPIVEEGSWVHLFQARLYSIARPVSETISMVDTRMTTMSAFRSEIVRAKDTKVSQVAKLLSDAIRAIEGTLIYGFNKVLLESIQAIDTKYRVDFYRLEAIRTIDRKIVMPMKLIPAEIISAVDNCSARPLKVFAEAIQTVDSYGLNVSKLCRELLRSVDARSSRVVFAVSDALHVSDIYSYGVLRPLTEVLQFVDVRVTLIEKELSDDIRLLNKAIQRMLSRDMNEVSHLSDVGVRMPWTVLAEALSVSDSLRRTLTVVKSDALRINDKVHKTYSRLFTELVSVGDSMRKFKSLFWRYGSKVEQTTDKTVSSQTSIGSSVEQTTDITEVDK